jgi:hypothetical protein
MQFELYWNGRVEGRVTDDSGKPAHVYVEIQNADGSRLPGYVNYFSLTHADSSYEINQIPPGRYIVLINPDGPFHDSLYATLYYPSALHRQEARVLVLGEGQEMKGIDFTVHRLAMQPTK